MKIALLLTAGISLLACNVASATVTLTISNGATGALTNLGDFAGNTADGLLWGILVDAAGDGFDIGLVTPGLSLTNYPNGVLLPSSNDDVLFLNTSSLTTTLAGVQGGAGAVTEFAGLVLNSALSVNQGDFFGIIWFGREVVAGVALKGGDHYGFLSLQSFTLPADGATQSYASQFIGVDPVRSTTFHIFPEPSSLMLSLVGVLPLLRRRR